MDKILIADDDPALRGLLRLVALRCGFQVDTAANGREALDCLDSGNYLIAVIDLMMPLVNGYEIVQQLAGVQERPAVLVVTAMADAHLPRMDGSVVHSIIRKPFDIDMISSVLTDLASTLKRRERGEEALGLPPTVVQNQAC